LLWPLVLLVMMMEMVVMAMALLLVRPMGPLWWVRQQVMLLRKKIDRARQSPTIVIPIYSRRMIPT